MKTSSTLMMILVLIAAGACGKKSSKTATPQVDNYVLAEEGVFEANLSALNEQLAGRVEGSARVRISGGQMHAQVKVNGAPASMSHAQYIHEGQGCPSMEHDTNGDGVIDAQEGMGSYGPHLIALNSALGPEKQGEGIFPEADFSGNYFYQQEAQVSEMMFRSNFVMSGRHVVIYGVSEDSSLPIACGTLVKVVEQEEMDPYTSGSKN
jgi:hypothetical protein